MVRRSSMCNVTADYLAGGPRPHRLNLVEVGAQRLDLLLEDLRFGLHVEQLLLDRAFI